VVVPVKVTELLFPARRELPWLRLRGWIVCGIVFLLGSRIAWYGWTQQARPRLGAALYHPPLLYLAGGFAAILALIALAYALRNFGRPHASGRTVPAWFAGLIAFVLGAAWFELIGMSFLPHPMEPFTKAIALGIGWALLAFVLFTWWSSRRAWTEMHSFCACWGATLACQAMPYWTIASWPKIDIIGKMIFDVGALALFLWLGTQVYRRQAARSTAS
jgi:hypothetical protein